MTAKYFFLWIVLIIFCNAAIAQAKRAIYCQITTYASGTHYHHRHDLGTSKDSSLEMPVQKMTMLSNDMDMLNGMSGIGWDLVSTYVPGYDLHRDILCVYIFRRRQELN